MTEKITIFPARKVITMNPVRPESDAVAIKGGRILAIGSVEELRGYGDFEIDSTFKDRVIIPGLIEAHSHIGEGTHWGFPYIGYYDRTGPDGKKWPGLKSMQAVMEKIKALNDNMADPDEPLAVWGFDPIFFEEKIMDASNLDKISMSRPIFVFHVSDHLASVNSALMRLKHITKETDVDGVVKGPDGNPTGELQEPFAMMLTEEIYNQIADGNENDQNWLTYGTQAKNAGCTTIAEMAYGSPADQDAVDRLIRIVDDPEFPVRVAQLYLPILHQVEDHRKAAQWIVEQGEQSTDKLKMGIVKYFLDGSIQGFTARIKHPGYHNGRPNGMWLTPPEELIDTLLDYHQANISMHCHCNGDQAIDVFLDAVEEVQTICPRPDHRHTVHHSQLTSVEQYHRMAKLGVCANIFSNHIYYWGDQHIKITLGPDRSQRMDACRTAKEAGVHFSMHSDAPITPIGQLHSAWAAVNRLTSSGQVLGEYERISVYDALYAVTLDAAYTLKMDHEVGSIEPGKFADFTVLEEDPFVVNPGKLKDIAIWGTVMGGRLFPAAS